MREEIQDSVGREFPNNAEKIEMSLEHIKTAMDECWGERCPDFEPECSLCQAWAQWDSLVGALAKNGHLREQVTQLLAEAEQREDVLTDIANAVHDQIRAQRDEALAEVARLRERLEINPEYPEYDGIDCRDETIKLLEQKLAKVRVASEVK
jgi:hypothetical protein